MGQGHRANAKADDAPKALQTPRHDASRQPYGVSLSHQGAPLRIPVPMDPGMPTTRQCPPRQDVFSPPPRTPPPSQACPYTRFHALRLDKDASQMAKRAHTLAYKRTSQRGNVGGSS